MQEASSPDRPEDQNSLLSQAAQVACTNETETQRPSTLSTGEVPQELTTGKPQNAETISTTPGSTEREAGQFRNEAASTQPHVTALPKQSLYTHERQYMVQPERGGCLTAWLVVIGIINTLALILGFAMLSASGSFGLLYIANGVLVLIGVVGAWQLKKWGYYILLSIYIISFVASLLILQSSVFPFIGSIVGLGTISALVLNKWDDFE